MGLGEQGGRRRSDTQLKEASDRSALARQKYSESSKPREPTEPPPAVPPVVPPPALEPDVVVPGVYQIRGSSASGGS